MDDEDLIEELQDEIVTLREERTELKAEIRNLQSKIDTALKYLGNVQDSLT